MDYFLLILGLLLIFVGIVGSFLPVLPGPPISWLGLLVLYFCEEISFNYWLLGITLLITLIVTIADYVIPAKGTKKFGGSKYGIWGTNIGLLIGLFVPPFGFLIGPFMGAFIGELIYNSEDQKRAFKAAIGSFVGFLASTFIKVFYCFLLLALFIGIVIENRAVWF